MKKLLIIISIVVALLVGGFFLTRWFSQQQQAAVIADLETVTLQQGTLSSSVGATGVVRSKQSAYLVWKIPGQVEQVYAEVGDTISAGDILAVLDDNSLPSYIILAQADLVNVQNQLDSLLTSSVQPAEALKAVEEAEKALEDARYPELAQAQAQAAIAAAEADLDVAKTQLAILTKPVSQAAVDQAYANLLMAEKQLNDLQDQIADTERKSKGPYDKPWESPKFYRRVLEGLNMQLPQLQLRYEAANHKYKSLLEPPDLLDIAVAEAAVFAAQAQWDDALLQYERIKNGVSPAEIGLLEAQLAEAQREYERVKDGVPSEDIAILEAQIAASEATLLQTQITAPFDGTVTLVETLPGDQVSTGSLAFRLDDLSSMLVDVNVSEIDINLVKLGQEVIVTFDAILAKEYHGKVVDVAPVGNTDTGIPSFTVSIELSDADNEIRSGMTSEVSIITSEVENVLLIPNRAIRLLDGERVVYVLRDTLISGEQQSPLNSIVPISVTLGASSDLFSVVLNGELAVGDKVILNPPSDGVAGNRQSAISVQIHP